MRIGETVKAVGVALAILALNFLATTVVITVFTLVAARGPNDTVQAAEIGRLAGWSAPIGGGLLFLATLTWLGGRRPERKAFAFAVQAWIAYVILDGASGVALGPVSTVLSRQMALSMAVALAGALVGAALTRRAPPAPLAENFS